MLQYWSYRDICDSETLFILYSSSLSPIILTTREESHIYLWRSCGTLLSFHRNSMRGFFIVRSVRETDIHIYKLIIIIYMSTQQNREFHCNLETFFSSNFLLNCRISPLSCSFGTDYSYISQWSMIRFGQNIGAAFVAAIVPYINLIFIIQLIFN